MTRPNNVTANYTYDKLSHLLSVLHRLSGSTIDGATYTLDSAGNRTAKTDQRANVTSNYGYDAIYELKSVTKGQQNPELHVRSGGQSAEFAGSVTVQLQPVERAGFNAERDIRL